MKAKTIANFTGMTKSNVYLNKLHLMGNKSLVIWLEENAQKNIAFGKKRIELGKKYIEFSKTLQEMEVNR